MRVLQCTQRSAEWHAARLGRVTSSRVADLLATRKDGKEAASRTNYRVQLALERLTGRSQERTFQSGAMTVGLEREVDATALYEALTGVMLQRVGFVQHDELAAGASPDGYVGDWEGLVEVKSPLPATHLGYLKTLRVPTEYLLQIRHQLWVTGAAWCDFLSYCPEFPEGLQTALIRVPRDPDHMAQHDAAVREFLAEVDREVEAIEALQQRAV